MDTKPDRKIKGLCVKRSCAEMLTSKPQQQRKRVCGSRGTGCQSDMMIRIIISD